MFAFQTAHGKTWWKPLAWLFIVAGLWFVLPPEIGWTQAADSQTATATPVLVDPARKGEAVAYFKSKGILVGEHYPQALVEQQAIPAAVREISSRCTRAREFCASELSLPVHPYLNDDEVRKVIAVCNQWDTLNVVDREPHMP